MHWMFEICITVVACVGSLAVMAALAYPIAHAMAGSLAMISDLSCPLSLKGSIIKLYWRWQSKTNGALQANSTRVSLMLLLQVLKSITLLLEEKKENGLGELELGLRGLSTSHSFKGQRHNSFSLSLPYTRSPSSIGMPQVLSGILAIALLAPPQSWLPFNSQHLTHSFQYICHNRDCLSSMDHSLALSAK